MTTHEDVHAQWVRFLDPNKLRRNLTAAAMFIAAFEILKDSIIGRLRSFFALGYDANGPVVGASYAAKVTSRNPSPLYASLDWLKESGAIYNADLRAFEQVKVYRNRLAHEMSELVVQGVSGDYDAQFAVLRGLLHKIEVWWIRNVEMGINPDARPDDFSDADILPGPVISLDVMRKVALGSDEESAFFYRTVIGGKGRA